MVYQKIGYTEIEVRYGSPTVKNRTIWGELVSYGKVWRAGANNATTVEFSAAVIIGGQKLEKGKYAFFIIPKENDKWTAIFNKVSKQWGAFKYNEREDALRVEISPQITNYKTENLTYTISQTGFKYGSIALTWDYMKIEVPFETNYLSAFKQEIESRANQQPEYIKWLPYLQGAEHLQQIGDSLRLAKSWINQAEKIMNATTEWNKQFYPRQYVVGHLYWVKAKLLASDGSYKEAVKYINQLKGLENTLFYKRKNETEEIDKYLEAWKKK
jgi:hypothetical protein